MLLFLTNVSGLCQNVSNVSILLTGLNFQVYIIDLHLNGNDPIGH